MFECMPRYVWNRLVGYVMSAVGETFYNYFLIQYFLIFE